MKKIFKYVLIALLLFLGLACACVLYLFFVRGSNIFGITYISKKDSIVSEHYEAHNIKTIELNSYDFDVEISNKTADKIYCDVKVGVYGFTKVENSEYKLQSDYDGDTNTLTITVVEPTGAVAHYNSKITLVLPDSFSNLNTLNIINHNADTTINLDKTSTTNLNYKAENGKLSIAQGKGFDIMDLDVGKGEVVLAEAAEINNTKTNLRITSGLLNASNSTLGEVHILTNTRSVLKIKQCTSLDTSRAGDYGGTIMIGETTAINYTGADTVFKIGKITNALDPEALNITLTKTGSITIEELNAIANLETNSGNIEIKKSLSMIGKAASNSGNITITDAEKNIRSFTNSGNITISFSEDAKSYNIDNSSRSVEIDNIKAGKLNLKGVEHFNITSTSSAAINIEANKLFGPNRINGSAGDINIKFDKNSILEIKATSTSGKARINVTSVPEYNGAINPTKTIYQNCSDTDTIENSLLVSTTSGNVTILSNNLE